jgi:hypothetical protein
LGTPISLSLYLIYVLDLINLFFRMLRARHLRRMFAIFCV